jgi:hypothetical protein
MTAHSSVAPSAISWVWRVPQARDGSEPLMIRNDGGRQVEHLTRQRDGGVDGRTRTLDVVAVVQRRVELGAVVPGPGPWLRVHIDGPPARLVRAAFQDFRDRD